MTNNMIKVKAIRRRMMNHFLERPLPFAIPKEHVPWFFPNDDILGLFLESFDEIMMHGASSKKPSQWRCTNIVVSNHNCEWSILFEFHILHLKTPIVLNDEQTIELLDYVAYPPCLSAFFNICKIFHCPRDSVIKWIRKNSSRLGPLKVSVIMKIFNAFYYDFAVCNYMTRIFLGNKVEVNFFLKAHLWHNVSKFDLKKSSEMDFADIFAEYPQEAMMFWIMKALDQCYDNHIYHFVRSFLSRGPFPYLSMKQLFYICPKFVHEKIESRVSFSFLNHSVCFFSLLFLYHSFFFELIYDFFFSLDAVLSPYSRGSQKLLVVGRPPIYG